jgi:hypothetical protein
MAEHPRSYFIHAHTGDSFPVDDPVAWCLGHARDPLLERARERLLTPEARTDPQRVLNVALRRCGLNLAEVRPGHVVVHHWTRLADIRPFCKRHRLAHGDVQVATVRHKNGVVTVQPGDDFLYGDRVGAGFPWEAYRQRWERRHEPHPDDWRPSPWARSRYSWVGVEEGRIPWAVLKAAWRRDASPACPNCDTALLTWSFDWRRRGLFNMFGHVARCCFSCRRSFEQPSGDLWPWLVTTLDAHLLPSWHDHGFGRTDLRPRWPASATRGLRDLGNPPADPTVEELVRILMEPRGRIASSAADRHEQGRRRP